jgi:hypothetical protein
MARAENLFFSLSDWRSFMGKDADLGVFLI